MILNSKKIICPFCTSVAKNTLQLHTFNSIRCRKCIINSYYKFQINLSNSNVITHFYIYSQINNKNYRVNYNFNTMRFDVIFIDNHEKMENEDFYFEENSIQYLIEQAPILVKKVLKLKIII